MDVIEKLEQHITESEVGQVHYLPHRPVIRSDKLTSKVRIVYDASSKIGNSPSLNDCLLPGPSLTENLFGVLIQFRLHRYAFSADIKEAFLQIMLDVSHRDFVRFLYLRSIKHCYYRVSRVLFGLSSSPFLLSGTLIHHAHNYASFDPEFVLHFIKSFHVDNLISGVDSLQEVESFYLKCRERLATANLSLRKFVSNSGSLNSRINNVTHENNSTKILRPMWNIKQDTLEFNFQEHMLLIQDTPAKLSLIKYFTSLYDPLGLLNSYIAKLKILFQKVCKVDVSWDQTIPQELVCEWEQIFEDICVVTWLLLRGGMLT